MAFISIHASREGSDGRRFWPVMCGVGFQSTLPAREATFTKRLIFTSSTAFQSTLPAREATEAVTDSRGVIIISIHASREGSDQNFVARTSWTSYFNPRFPRGKRRKTNET